MDFKRKNKVEKISIVDKAKEFLTKKINNNEFFIDSSEFLNDRRLRQFLVENEFLCSPIKWLYIIKDNTLDKSIVYDQNYYKINSKIWEDCILSWNMALNYYLWHKEKLKTVEFISSSKNTKINVNEQYYVEIKKSDAYRKIKKESIHDGDFLVETELSFVINNYEKYKDNKNFKILMNSMNFDFKELRELLTKDINVASLSKLANYYKDNDNIRNFTIIKNELKKSWKSFVTNWKSIGIDKWELSWLFKNNPNYSQDTVSPKIERFKSYIKDIENSINNSIININLKKECSLDKLLDNIKSNIIHDTYHSLTIEDYHVNLSDIAILNNPTDKNEKISDEIKNKLAIKWYLWATKYIKENIKYNFNHNDKISESFLQNINRELFLEFSKSQWFEIPLSYRKVRVSITNTTHTPPDINDVKMYMDEFIKYINEMSINSNEDVIKKAVLAHFLFVYIHPFEDWNWRTGRFLMNYILSSNGLNWLTILSENKENYIKWLKKWSEKWDLSNFLEYIINEYDNQKKYL